MIPDFLKAIGVILLTIAAGFISGIANTKKSQEWYQSLELPSLNPPAWVFPPVWALLYSAMGLASFLVWRNGGGFTGKAKLPLIVYVIQLAFTLAYSPIFFGLQNIQIGFIDIIAATVAATICAILFYRIKPIAGCLFIPYVAWLSFATYLNYSIWKMNPETKEHVI